MSTPILSVLPISYTVTEDGKTNVNRVPKPNRAKIKRASVTHRMPAVCYADYFELPARRGRSRTLCDQIRFV